MLDAIADAEQETYLGVWADIQMRAARRFEMDLTTELGKKYKLNQLQRAIDLLQVIDALTNQTAAAPEWRGWVAELAPKNTNLIINSSFHGFRLQSISLYRKANTIAIAAKVFDADTGALLASITIPAGGPGWTTVNVGTRILASRVMVVYDATLVESVWHDISNAGLWSDCGDCGYLNLKGVKSTSLSTTLKYSDVSLGNNIYGISAVFSVECTFQSLVCNSKHHFLDSWWKLCGAETMQERIYSPRKNIFTTIERKRGQELLNHYEVEYEAALKLAVNGLQLNPSDCCLECNDTYRIVESI